MAHIFAPAIHEVYLGVVKSYNDRRGFGFVACGLAEKFVRERKQR